MDKTVFKGSFILFKFSFSLESEVQKLGVDTVSRRQYVLNVKDLTTGEIFDTSIQNSTGGSAWAQDNEHFFYTLKKPETLRSEAIYRHTYSDLTAQSELIFEEKD